MESVINTQSTSSDNLIYQEESIQYTKLFEYPHTIWFSVYAIHAKRDKFCINEKSCGVFNFKLNLKLMFLYVGIMAVKFPRKKTKLT